MIASEKVRITKLQTYFKTETTREELEKEFIKVIEHNLISELNALLAKFSGIRFPTGTKFLSAS